jgi:hypothetical protein
MITEISEPITVAAVFRQGRVTPKVFSWRGRRYQVKQVLGDYHYFKGFYRQNCYSITCDTSDVFEIALDTEDMSWRLERMHVEG